jgi:hypothetical protein
MKEPPLRRLACEAWHRLIPSRFSQSGTVLSTLVDTPADLENIVLLDGATNERIQGELSGLPGISTYELVYGVPNATIVNAAFTHANESGSRFSDNTRGAWYAADDLQASISEVVYHKGKRLADIVVPEEPNGRPRGDVATFDDWLADFRSTFHVLDPPDAFIEYLQPEPVPECYSTPQAFARHLLASQSNGLVYPSVRRKHSQCVACFRPALVYNPRRSGRFEITLFANKIGYDHTVRPVLFDGE